MTDDEREELKAAFDAAFRLDPDAPENRLKAWRNNRAAIEVKQSLLPTDLEDLRKIDREIARALIEIHQRKLDYWCNIDTDHVNVRFHALALEDLAAKHPELFEDDPEEESGEVGKEAIDQDSGVSGTDPDNLVIPNYNGITLEDVDNYPRENIPVSIRTGNRDLDALRMLLRKEGWNKDDLNKDDLKKKDAITRSIKAQIYNELAPGKDASGDKNKESTVNQWLRSARRLIESTKKHKSKK